jgi:hypothetical protein
MMIGIMPFENIEIIADGEDNAEITLSETSIEMYLEETYKLIANREDVIWDSTDPSVAGVDDTGIVFAVGVGDAVIIASSSDGNYSASCDVTVKEYVTATDQDTEVKYPLWVGSVQVTSKNKDDILDDNGKAKYYPEAKTLTLSGATITGSHSEGSTSAGIFVTDGNLNLTISLSGENKEISTTATYGVLSNGSVTIAGNGKLTANGTYTGINTMGDLTIKDKADLTVTSSQGIYATSVKISGSTVTAKGSGSGPNGIQASKSLEITDSTISVTGYSRGLSAASVKISGSNVTATGSGSGSIGIYTGGSLEISDSKVNASGNHHGMQAASVKILSDSDVTATGSDTVSYSDGIYTGGSLEITDSTVNATGNSYGMLAASVKISGSKNITATASGSGSYGIFVTAGDLEITDSTVNVTGGERGLLTYSAKISGSSVIATGSSQYGIHANRNMEITDSTVEASGLNYGVFLDSSEKLLIKGESTVKAKSTSDSFGSDYAGIMAAEIKLDGVEIVKPANGTIKDVYIYGPNDSNPSKDVEIKPIKGDYAIASGADGTYTLDSGSDYVLTVKRSVNDHRCFNHFEGVKLDEQALTKDADYTAVKGSVVITLNKATLNSLTEGDHTITVNFDDGKAETSLTVKVAPAPTPAPTPVTPYQIPKTGIE